MDLPLVAKQKRVRSKGLQDPLSDTTDVLIGLQSSSAPLFLNRTLSAQFTIQLSRLNEPENAP
jgi:hypothetical protein